MPGQSGAGQGAWVGLTGRCGGWEQAGFDLGFGADGYFDHTGSSAHFKACDGGSVRFKL